MRFHLGWKSHFGVESALYLCSHELRRNETQNEIKFQTGMRFSNFHVRGCLCDNCTPNFLSLLIFYWRIVLRRVTARWWRQSGKNQVSTNQNSRNRWCLIVRHTVCEHNLPKTKWISADSLDVAFNAHVRLKLNAGMDFKSLILTEIKFHFGW